MPEGQDKVLEAFEALQKALKKALKVSEAFKALQKALKKALKEEQERLNDPTVAKLFRMLGNERLRLVEWLLSEVQRLAAIWRKGKAPDRVKPRKGKRRGKGRRRRTRKRGGHPNRFFRPFILRALAQLNGRGRAKDVLELVYQMVKPHLSPVDEEWLPSGNDYRWRRKANWERYNMVRDGLLRDDSPQGIWELTEEGWRKAKKLIAGKTQEQ